MLLIIRNGIPLNGSIPAPPSKSEAIRAALLLALCGRDPAGALAGYESASPCDDIAFAVSACRSLMRGQRIDVGESAALLRMILPVSLALTGRADIGMGQRLAERGLGELEDTLGVELKPENGRLRVDKKLRPGSYSVDCSRSSQFLSGLLIALPMLSGESEITIKGEPVSKGYADMTIAYASLFGARLGAGFVQQGQSIRVYPSKYTVPQPPYTLADGSKAFASGDCSYAAVFGAMNLMGSCVEVTGISGRTLQPDIVFPAVAGYSRINVSAMPDLLPPLAAVACSLKRDTVLTGVSRLKTKESDRPAAMAKLIRDLGGQAEAGEDELTIHGSGSLAGGCCDSAGDHRLAMAAAALACICDSPVRLNGAEAVSKSAPDFWNDYGKLGGFYEYLRQ